MGGEGRPEHYDGFHHRLYRWLMHDEARDEEKPVLLAAVLGLVLPLAVYLLLIVVPLVHIVRGLLQPGEGTILRDSALILAAALGGPFAVWRTWVLHRQSVAALRQAGTATRQAEIADQNRQLTEQRNLTDRFVKAVEMIGARAGDKPVLEQRLGGIYALEQLARESRQHHAQIMEVLCAYIRENSPASKAREFPGAVLDHLSEAGLVDAEIEASEEFRRAMGPRTFSLAELRSNRRNALDEWVATLDAPGEDVRGALTVIVRRGDEQRRWEGPYRLDLTRTCLQRAYLSGAHLEGVRLDGAALDGAHLDGAHLEDARLSNARLQGAVLDRARLDHSNFTCAKMEGASLRNAVMRRGELDAADLSYSDLSGAVLKWVDFRYLRLCFATLRFCIIWGREDLLGGREELGQVSLAGAVNEGGWRHVSLTSAADLSSCFGDGSVLVELPAHWPSEILDKGAFTDEWVKFVRSREQEVDYGQDYESLKPHQLA